MDKDFPGIIPFFPANQVKRQALEARKRED
jgi:hypothetical protein